MTTWNYDHLIGGAAYNYDQNGMLYDGPTFSGKPVKYNSVGTATAWTFTNKS